MNCCFFLLLFASSVRVAWSGSFSRLIIEIELAFISEYCRLIRFWKFDYLFSDFFNIIASIEIFISFHELVTQFRFHEFEVFIDYMSSKRVFPLKVFSCHRIRWCATYIPLHTQPLGIIYKWYSWIQCNKTALTMIAGKWIHIFVIWISCHKSYGEFYDL